MAEYSKEKHDLWKETLERLAKNKGEPITQADARIIFQMTAEIQSLKRIGWDV